MQTLLVMWPLLFLTLLAVVECNDECTQGFMDYELLRVKASHIGDSIVDDTVTGIGAAKMSHIFVQPVLNFTCVGAITGFLLAVDIRIDEDRDEYPWIGLFNHNAKFDTYTLVPGSNRSIILGPDDFSTSGLYNYTLSSPIQFTSGNIIGIYQPATDRSVVRLQQKQQHGTSTDRIIRIKDDGTASNHVNINSTLLVLPLTSNTSCLNSGFISHEDLLINARLVGLVSQFYGIFSDNNVFFKDIRFTCNGSMTNIIVGMNLKAYDESSSPLPPEIRIWRSSNDCNTYTQSGPTIPLYYSDAVSDISTDYLRWYNLSAPVPVNEGDVLGIYHDDTLGNHESVITHQRYSGPYNYYSNNKVFDYNIYPMVSVVISMDSNPGIIDSTPSMRSTSTNTNPHKSMTTSSSTTFTCSSSSIIITTPSSSTTTAIDTTEANDSMSASASVGTSTLISVASILAILIQVAVVSIAVIVIVTKRRKKSHHTTSEELADHPQQCSISNKTYERNVVSLLNKGNATNIPLNVTHPINGRAGTVENYPSYEDIPYEIETDTLDSLSGSDGSHSYQSSSINSTNPLIVLNSPKPVEAKLDDTSLTNAMYDGSWGEADSKETKLYNTIWTGICVPTQAQRQEITVDGVPREGFYHVLESNNGRPGDHERFFAEESIYWDPENSTSGVYEQLAQRRYREIPRHRIRLVSHLGSGQFGTVDKGIWDTPKGPVEVAVKTLSGSVTEEDEVKFLQEAAINGQFHHPNVIQLCGVVTVGQPTMIVLEYITHGDLELFLRNVLRPNPGELPDASLAPLLLKFSHQVARGMDYLSRKKFIHRDLAARNILVDNGTVCKIADFGMSKYLLDETYYRMRSKKIPVKWTAPEAIHYRKYTTQSDVWSFGVLLYEIWSVGHKPFEKSSNLESIRLIESGYRLPSPSGCPRTVYQIMINCWNPVPSDRPSFDSLQSLLSCNPQSLSSPSDHPLSNLGSSVLLHNQSLYPELQNKYT